MRWLSHRGGALDYLEHCRENPDTPYPIAVVLGCDPATILGAVTPVPIVYRNINLRVYCVAVVLN